MQQKYSDYQYILAYSLFFIIMYMIGKTRLGYVLIYYSLALFAFTLVLLSANYIQNTLKPISG